jgi:hypothetical protein
MPYKGLKYIARALLIQFLCLKRTRRTFYSVGALTDLGGPLYYEDEPSDVETIGLMEVRLKNV